MRSVCKEARPDAPVIPPISFAFRSGSGIPAGLTATDSSTLFKRLEAAEAAVRIRRAALQGGSDDQAELLAIEDALRRLADIKNTYQEHPAPPLEFALRSVP